jgi:hypothetical protein
MPRYTEADAREAIAKSKSWSAALRRLGYCPTGGNPKTLKKYAELWGISTEHFDPYAGLMERIRPAKRPLGGTRRMSESHDQRGIPRPETRKADRPPYEQLLDEVQAAGYSAVGRKYGVSDNAVRKWVHFYERQREREEAEVDAAAEMA